MQNRSGFSESKSGSEKKRKEAFLQPGGITEKPELVGNKRVQTNRYLKSNAKKTEKSTWQKVPGPSQAAKKGGNQ